MENRITAEQARERLNTPKIDKSKLHFEFKRIYNSINNAVKNKQNFTFILKQCISNDNLDHIMKVLENDGFHVQMTHNMTYELKFGLWIEW